MKLDKELENILKQKGYKKVECPNEQKESKDYKDMMKAIEEYKKEMKSNERKKLQRKTF